MFVASRKRNLSGDIRKRLEVSRLHRSVCILAISIKVNQKVFANLQHAWSLGELLREWLGYITPRPNGTIGEGYAQIHFRS